jgi:hypothetical protein
VNEYRIKIKVIWFVRQIFPVEITIDQNAEYFRRLDSIITNDEGCRS